VTGGIAVVAILILAGLGFAFWRAALAAYKRVVATTKTDDGETPVEHLASAPLHSHELLPLQRYKKARIHCKTSIVDCFSDKSMFND